MDTRAGRRALRGRAAGAGADGPPDDRAGLRRRRHARGPAVLRDGVRQGRADHRLLRPAPALDPRSGSSCSSQVCDGVQHAHQKGDHPPRPEAVEHAGHAARRRPVPKIIDFGVAKATDAAADRAHAAHRARRAHRHARVHEPRAGGDDGARRRHAHRRLLAGRDAVRAADGARCRSIEQRCASRASTRSAG